MALQEDLQNYIDTLDAEVDTLETFYEQFDNLFPAELGNQVAVYTLLKADTLKDVVVALQALLS